MSLIATAKARGHDPLAYLIRITNTMSFTCDSSNRLPNVFNIFSASASSTVPQMSALALILMAGLWSTEVNAQSYNEVMSDLSAQDFQRDVQRRISSGINDGPSFYFTTDYAAKLLI